MSQSFPVKLMLTVLQAESLLQLAQEADPETLVSEDGISAFRRRRAADAAMESVIKAMGRAKREETCKITDYRSTSENGND